MIKFVLLIALVCGMYEMNLGCGLTKMQINSLKNCDTTSVLKLSKGFKSLLTEDCKVKPTGCVTTKQDLKAAKLTYDIKKDGMPLMGTFDACKEMETADEDTVKLVMTLLGIPPKCPIPAGKRCANKTSIDISEQKGKLGAAVGSYQGTINMDHGDGKKSCIELDAKLLSVNKIF